MPGGKQADLAVELADDAGHGGLAGAGVSDEHEVRRGHGGGETLEAAHAGDFLGGDEPADLVLGRREAGQIVELAHERLEPAPGRHRTDGDRTALDVFVIVELIELVGFGIDGSGDSARRRAQRRGIAGGDEFFHASAGATGDVGERAQYFVEFVVLDGIGLERVRNQQSGRAGGIAAIAVEVDRGERHDARAGGHPFDDRRVHRHIVDERVDGEDPRAVEPFVNARTDGLAVHDALEGT
ncbi:unannotated protein [freshwater metagenome]|uniref:Unannotated protein n=1 Tax=freshwater metagenome TaxID=449393 RepID=A0A6J6IDW1_9ZZZZ